MKAKIITIRTTPPRSSERAYMEAETGNGILIVFGYPTDQGISLSDELDFDLENLDHEQIVKNLTTGGSVHLSVKNNNVHDLRLPMKHGGSRFPSPFRRAGG